MLAGLKELEERAARAGRSMDSISVSVFAPAPDPGVLARFRDAGALRAILWLAPEDADATTRRLDRYAELL